MRKGADIKAKDKEGMHALGRAVLHADVETVRFLVENGSDMSDRSGFGEFGLGLYFVRTGSADCGILAVAGRESWQRGTRRCAQRPICDPPGQNACGGR